MYNKWIRNGFVLAIILVSMVSLSMAACPWLIKNEFYTAQCGVQMVVPASAGLLANDLGATAVLNPDSITIDAKYGTLHVNADGSFVFDPSPDILTGTYVQFNYNATNGVCQARYPGLAKIQVSCKCRAQAANVILCLPTTLAEIKQKLVAAGAGCLGCGATSATIDLSNVKLVPGTYSYSVKCGGYQAVSGTVTLVSGCKASAPSFTFCGGTVTLAQLQGMIFAQADCIGTGCDQAPLINTAGVTVANGFVTGGSYTATCGAGTNCADTATGIITVTPRCEAKAPSFRFCEGTVTLAQLTDMIKAQATCTGNGCSAPTIGLSNVNVEAGFVSGGSYTATCGAGTICANTATGTITVVPKCVVDLVGVTLECGTPAQIEAQIKSDNSAPCGDCDTTPAFQFPVWPLKADGSGNVANGVYQYTVTCNAGGLQGCDSSAIGEVIVDCQEPCPCVATAKDVTVCAGLVTLDQLKANYLPGNVSCKSTIGTICDVTAKINTSGVTVDANGFVTGGTYKAICQPTSDCLAVEATGKVTAIDCCTCKASAPGFTLCEGTVTLAQLQGMIFAQADCIGTNCDQTPLINTAGVTVANGFVTGGSYTATCGAGTACANTSTGTITVTPRCEAKAPSFRFCEGTVTLAQLTDMIKAQATCTGNGCSAPMIDLSNVEVVDEFVSGGNYTATCGAGTICANTATGTITVVPKCVVDLIGVTLECGTPEQIEAQIKSDNSAPCGDCDTTPAFQFPVWPLKADGSGNVANGVYQYTVTCNAGGLQGCDSSAIGEVIVDCQEPCPCVATAKDVTVCAGLVTLDQLEDDYLPGNVSCKSTIGTICDVTAKINTSGVTVDANGFVTGGTYKAICQPTSDCLGVEATGTVTAIDCCTCKASAPGFTLCEGKVTLAQLQGMIFEQAECIGTGCDQAPLINTAGVTVANGFVTGGSYTATCAAGTNCEDTAIGTITVTPRCEANAPSFTFCEGTVNLAQLTNMINAQAKCTGNGCSAPTIDLSGVDVEDGFVSGGSYTATCGVGTDCEDTATGTITVVPRCEVDLIGVTFGCGTPAQIEAEIKEENPAPCGDCDTTPAFQFPVWPLRADGSGKVASGKYQYTVTCNAGGLQGCDSSAIGEVIVDCQEPCPCVATANDVTVCAGLVTLDQLEDNYLPGNVSCRSTIGALCDVTAEIDTENVTVVGGFVTGGTYKAICQPNDDCLPVEATGRVTTKTCEICTCEANAPDICVPYICTRTICHQYSLDEITNEIKYNGGGCSTGCTMTLKFYVDGVETSFSNLHWNGVYHYTYKVTCTKGTCVDTATGALNVLKLADCSCHTCNCK